MRTECPKCGRWMEFHGAFWRCPCGWTIEHKPSQAPPSAVSALLKAARRAYDLIGEADMGPRQEQSEEWRIPWNAHTVEVFSELHAAIRACEESTP